MPRRLLVPSVLVLSLALAPACSSTSFKSTWKAPDAEPIDSAGKKVAAVFISPEEGTRRAAEDALARELTERGAQGVPAYTLVSLDDLQDKEHARAKLREAGCAGVVVMRVLGEEQRVSASQSMYAGTRYSSFSGYSHWGWGSVYAPGYLDTDTYVSVETLVYSLEQDKLLWGGTSETFEPSKIEKLVAELADAVAGEMEDEGLIR